MDDGLKQRLVGAVVLVAVAIIFVPSLFSNDGRKEIDLSTQVPPEPVIVAEPLELDPPKPPPVVRPAKPLEDNYPHQPDPEFADDPPPASDAESSEPSTEVAVAASEVKPSPVLNEAGVPDAWSVQVASFSESPRATQFLETVREKGYSKSYVKEGKTGSAKVYRVFVGPKINKQEALNEKARLDKDFNIQSLIVSFEP